MLRSFNGITRFLLIAVLTAPGTIFSQELKPQQIYQRITPSVLTLKILNTNGERFTASAFLALREGVAVTAWHTVHDAQYVYAVRDDGMRVEVKGLIDRDEVHDVALIAVDLADRPLVPVNDTTLTIGSRLYVLGAPKGFGFSIADGLLSQIQTIDGFKQYQISCPLSTGNSGGPVVDEGGEVVGVASWSRLDAQNVNFAVPIEYAKGMNPNRAAISWEAVKLPATETASGGNAGRLSEPEDDLAALRGYLKRSAGRKVTVIVQEAEENRKFTFVVPE